MRLFLEQREASLLTKVSEFLSREDIDSYLVGGYVRDTLLGRPTRDIDITVDAFAPEVAEKMELELRRFLDRYSEKEESPYAGRTAVGYFWSPRK